MATYYDIIISASCPVSTLGDEVYFARGARRNTPATSQKEHQQEHLSPYQKVLKLLPDPAHHMYVQQHHIANLKREDIVLLVKQMSDCPVIILKGSFLPFWIQNLGNVSSKSSSCTELSDFFSNCSQVAIDSNNIVQIDDDLYIHVRGVGSHFDRFRLELTKLTYSDPEVETAFKSLETLYHMKQSTLEKFNLTHAFLSNCTSTFGTPSKCFFLSCNAKITSASHFCTFLQNTESFKCATYIGCDFITQSKVKFKDHHSLHLSHQCCLEGCKMHSTKPDFSFDVTSIGANILHRLDDVCVKITNSDHSVIVICLKSETFVNYCISKLPFSAYVQCNHTKSNQCRCAAKILRCKNILNTAGQHIKKQDDVNNLLSWSQSIENVPHCSEKDFFILSSLSASKKLLHRNINDILNLKKDFNVATIVFAIASNFEYSDYGSNANVLCLSVE